MASVAAFIVVGVLAGCSDGSGEDQSAATSLPSDPALLEIAEGTPPVEVHADSPYPAEDPADIITYADKVAVFRVVAERDDEPQGGQEPYIARFVEVEIVDTLWESQRLAEPSGAAPEGILEFADMGDSTSTFEFTTWGRVIGGDPPSARPITGEGEPRLEVGRTYLGAFFYDGTELTLWPGSLLAVDESGRVVEGDSQTLVGETSEAIDRNLAGTEPHQAAIETASKVPDLWYLNAESRLDAIWETTNPDATVAVPTTAP